MSLIDLYIALAPHNRQHVVESRIHMSIEQKPYPQDQGEDFDSGLYGLSRHKLLPPAICYSI